MRHALAVCFCISLASAVRAAEPAHDHSERTAALPEFGAMKGHMNDDPVRAFLLVDRLEWQTDGRDDAAAWNIDGWIGKDTDRLWLRSEGERASGVTESGNIEALWGRPVARWWDLLAGVRHDFAPGSSRTWAAVGVTGLAPYGFETQLTAYVGQHGATLLQLEFEYELLLTQRWILQPRLEARLYGKDDAMRSIDAGLAESALGLRLRYELRREFAPYAGVEWSRSGGGAAQRLTVVAGVRAWL